MELVDASWHHALHETSALEQFHHQAYLVVNFKDLEKLHDVGMV